MEKGNQVGGGTTVQQATNGGGAAAGGGAAGGAAPGGEAPGGAAPGGEPSPGPGTGTGTPPPGTPPPVAPSGGGGGSQADQGGPKRDWLNELGEQEHELPGGSKMRYDGKGGAEYEEQGETLRLEGNQWVDTKTGDPRSGGMADRADAQLWETEQQLRLNPPR